MTDIINVTTLAGLNRIIAATDKLVIKYTAPSWCVPCQRLKPHYDAVAKERTDYVFVSVDMDQAEEALVKSAGVQSVPTVHEFLHGEYFREIKGRTAMAILKELG